MILRVSIFVGVLPFLALGASACSHNEGMPDRQLQEMNETVGKMQVDQDKEAKAFLDEPTTTPQSAPVAAKTGAPRTVELNANGSDGENDDPDAPAERPAIKVEGRGGGGSVSTRPMRTVKPGRADDRADGPRSPTLDPEAKTQYDNAIHLVQAKQFDRALEELSSFLTKYPDHPYVENAMYWKGECLFARGEYLRAAEQFEAVVNKYGAGKKGADSLLKLGMCHDKLGASDRANQYWDRLRRDFPRSDAVKKIPASAADSTRRTAGPKESR